MRYAAVVNAAAGTTRRLGTEALTSLLNERLDHHLMSLRYADGRGLCTACEEAIRDKPDALIVLGGDGTCRTAAAMAAEQNIPIVLLPGGTMNVLPKRIWGEQTLEHALQAVASRSIQPGKLDMGVANGQAFFVAAMFGLMPALARVREKFRGANGTQTLNAMRELGSLSRTVLNSSVRATADELKAPLNTTGLIVSVGDVAQLVPGEDPDESFRAFECVALNLNCWSDAGRIAWKALRHGDWRADAKIDNFTTRRLTAQSGRSTWVTLDGEPQKLRGPVEVTYRRNALTVVVPKQANAANDNTDRTLVGSSLPG